MNKIEHYILYFINILILSLISLISFKGVIIASLSYLLTCEIIKSNIKN